MPRSEPWPQRTPRTDFLKGRQILLLTSKASGSYAGRLLHLLGATITRADLPTSWDCPTELTGELFESFFEGIGTLYLGDRQALADLAPSLNLIITDSLHDDAFDGRVVERVRNALASLPSTVRIIEIESSPLDGNLPEPGSTLTASAKSAMAWAIGTPGREPLTLPFDFPDYLAGTEAAAASALALLLPANEGSHRAWRISTSEVLAYYVGQICSNFVAYERPWARDGARATMSGGSYPAAMFRCSDGWVSVMCRTQPEWHGLIEALGTPSWAEKEGYRDSRIVARLHADEIDPYVEAWCESRTRHEVFNEGQRHGFPVAPVLTVGEALNEEQFAHRQFFTQPTGKPIIPGSPYRVTEPATTGRPRVAATGSDRGLPLEGLTVLDLSWVWSGPMVTGALVDLGAEVIKVENRKRADPSRLRGRALRDGLPVDGPELEVTPYFNQLNRGKKSVEIDISTPEGADLVRQLAKQADVVVENMRPGVLNRLGLDYSQLSDDHPELVMVSLSMLGQTGPLSGIRGYAVVMSGLAGVDSLIGYDTDNLIGTFNPALGDPNGAAHALTALLAALCRARTTGKGAWIDVSQVESLLSVLRVPVAMAQSEAPAVPPANGHSHFWPHGMFRTAGDDTWVAVAARTAAERSRLAAAISNNHGVETAQFERASGDLEKELAEFAGARSTTEVVATLIAQGIPTSPVQRYEDMRVDRGLGAIHQVKHPWLGDQDMVALPWLIGDRRLRTLIPSPELGSSTDEVLRERLNLSSNQVDDLRADGAVGPRP